MRNTRYIVNIDQLSGLPPQVVNSLNSNFWNLLQMIESPEVVMVAGVNPPDPRTDESLWYKTDTGVLNVWSKGDDDTWGWESLGSIIDQHIDVSAVTDYNRLTNKPSIESVTLVGDKTFPDLGIFIDYDDEMSDNPASDMYALTTQDINALWSM